MFKRVSFRLLKNLGILTEFDFNENYVCYNYTVKRYSNVLDSQKNICVYQVGFTNEQGFFNAINDADTHLIYQYDYYNKKHGDKENIEIYTFGRKYLGLTEKEIHKYLFKMGDNQTYITDSPSY